MHDEQKETQESLPEALMVCITLTRISEMIVSLPLEVLREHRETILQSVQKAPEDTPLDAEKKQVSLELLTATIEMVEWYHSKVKTLMPRAELFDDPEDGKAYQ